jgi:hypothetical protein
MTINDSLQQLDSDSVDFGQVALLIIQNALQNQVAGSPIVTPEEFVALVRDVLARGYYFFKARTKTKR